MLRIVLIETVYPAPEFDEDDYCPDGDTSTEEVEVGFKELVALMRGYTHPSSSPASGSVYEWLSAENEQDFRSGDWTVKSIHYDTTKNHARYAKYWRWAMRAAGVRVK